MNDYLDYLEKAISMSKAAGQVLMEYFRSDKLDIHTKINDYDVVTDADKASEKLLKEIIRESYPSHGIIAEESGEEHAEREWRWIIDPLDGTTSFSQGLPVFSVSIALEHNGESVVGVVYAPYLGELFHAVKGGGAFLNGRQIRCSSKSALSEAVIASALPYDKLENPDNNLREITKVVTGVRGFRRMGSAAIALSYVGAGFLDAYWELNLKRWDVAAGKLIAKEAGAKVVSIRDNRNFSLLASSPKLFPSIMEKLSEE